MRKKRARLTVITGPMGSGKSDLLIENLFLHDGVIAAARPLTDTRDPGDQIVSHKGSSFCALRFDGADDLLARLVHIDRLSLVAIDEAHMVSKKDLLKITSTLIDLNADVIVCGLRHDFRREAFKSIEAVLIYADAHLSLRSTCALCGKLTSHTVRLTEDTAQIIPGDAIYQPRCLVCWEVRP